MTSFSGFKGDQALQCFLQLPASGCTTTSALGGMQRVEWTATSPPRNTAFLKACHLPWERNTSQKESQGGIRAKSLRWAATSKTKVSAQPRLGVPLVFSVALARAHCESKTSCPVLETPQSPRSHTAMFPFCEEVCSLSPALQNLVQTSWCILSRNLENIAVIKASLILTLSGMQAWNWY